MIVDNEGNVTSSIADALQAPAPPKPRNYKPGPGRVTVLREQVKAHYNEELDLAKPVQQIQFEKAFSIFATVARVGDILPGGMVPWFRKGDLITIIPSMFDEVELAPGMYVFCGPFSAVTGIFEDEKEPLQRYACDRHRQQINDGLKAGSIITECGETGCEFEKFPFSGSSIFKGEK